MTTQMFAMIVQRGKRVFPHFFVAVLIALLLLLIVNDRNWRPLQGKADWQAASNYSQAGAHFAIDRDIETWWSSYLAMTFGMWVQVDVGKIVTMNGVALHVTERNKDAQPRAWTVKVSPDGKEWQPARARDAITSGKTLLIPFDAARARFVQVIQTAVSVTPSSWCINELDVMQPVLPVQFARSTLISAIFGWLFIMAAAYISTRPALRLPIRNAFSFSEPVTPINATLLPVMLLAAIGAGWLLRVIALPVYEFSPHEYAYSSPAAFGQYSPQAWLSAYFDYSKTGAFWLQLLLIRGLNQWCLSQFAAFRLIPAMFGVGAALLIFLVWRGVSQSRLAVWEALTGAAVFSAAGWPIILNRNGDFFTAPLFWFLLSAWLSYRLLYQRGAAWLFPLFSLAAVLGVCLHPGLLLFPVGALLFAAWHLRLCSHAPGWLQAPHVQSYYWPQNIRRLIAYGLALLPMLAAWLLLGEGKAAFFHVSPANLLSAAHEFFDALRVCGIVGTLGNLAFFGLALLGVIFALAERSHGEWWFASTSLLFAFALLMASDGYISTFGLLLLLLLCFLLCAKGAIGLIAFLTPRETHRRRQFAQAGCVAMFAGYLGVFSMNSLFWGAAWLPHDAPTLAEQQARAQMTVLSERILQDPNDCATMLAFDARLRNMLTANYRLPVGLGNFAEAQRLAAQGMLETYIFTDIAAAESPDVAAFLRQYYREIGRGAGVIAHQARQEFLGLPQRYYSEDLFFNTGRYVEDAASTRGRARQATAADAPGLLSFGPFCRICRPGNYVARFALRTDEPTRGMAATLSVVQGNYDVQVRRSVREDDLVPAGTYQAIDVPFAVDFLDSPANRMKRYQFLVEVTGKADLRLDYIELKHDEP